jgi:hypothetical protein
MTVLSHFWQAPQDHEANVRSELLCREFLAEREDILLHKWLESEMAGIFANGIAYEHN